MFAKEGEVLDPRAPRAPRSLDRFHNDGKSTSSGRDPVSGSAPATESSGAGKGDTCDRPQSRATMPAPGRRLMWNHVTHEGDLDPGAASRSAGTRHVRGGRRERQSRPVSTPAAEPSPG